MRTHIETALLYDESPDPLLLLVEERIDGPKAERGEGTNPTDALGDSGDANSRRGVVPVDDAAIRGVVEIGV